MNQTIDPRVFERVCDILVHAGFEFYELDALMLQCIGEYRMDWVANPSNPPAKIVVEGLRYVEKKGVADRFLAFALKARSDDRTFRETMLQCLPRLADIDPAAQPPVDPLLIGIRRARDLTADPAVKSALSTMQESIAAFRESVGRLKAYKALHDCLHTILKDRPPNLDQLLSGFRNNESDRNELSSYLDTIGMRRANAENECEQLRRADLPAGGEDFARERSWIDRLKSIEEDYRSGLNKKQRGPVKFAINSIVSLAASHLSHLNLAIVAISQNLRLEEIGTAMIVAMDALGDGANEDTAIFSDAARTAANLQAFLRTQVAKHDAYQRANDELETICVELYLPPQELFESDIVEVWQPVKSRIRSIAAIRTDGFMHWQSELRESIQKVDAALEHLVNAFSAEQGSEAALMTPEEAGDELRTSLTWCRTKCFTQFFFVDLALMRECDRLNPLELPIQELLDRI
ncbi:MAG: hypothetical protein VYD64_06690 [Pseudomonadota bacterium]|nr:hypothetical protein [Pseudomonadota bacterium]